MQVSDEGQLLKSDKHYEDSENLKNYGNDARREMFTRYVNENSKFSNTVYQFTRKLVFHLQDRGQFYVKVHPDPGMTVTLLNIYI